MKKIIYLDNSATTPVRPEVVLAMKPYWGNHFGNAGSITKIGVKAKQALEDSRRKVGEILKARSSEIVFTASGTESNNLAILGLVNNLEKRGLKISDLHFITTNIEHSSVLECFKEIERRGGKVDYLEVNNKGLINIKDLRKIIQPNTVLVSIGYANSEIGVIQPIKDIAKEIRHARKCHQGNSLNLQKGISLMPYFHTDASQAGLYLNLNVLELGVDLLTLDAQKIYGPKGVAVLFIKSGIQISPILFGGGQESGLRSGTENTALIVGMAKALEICRQDDTLNLKKGLTLASLRNYFWQKIQTGIPEAILNGDLENRLPNNLNISIPGIDSEFTVLCLDEQGIICSTKSACNHDDEGSLIVSNLYKGLAFEGQALGKSTLRFSLGEDITKSLLI
jgi:cysteine desulfurase